MFVSQAHPEVVVLVQQDLLLAGVSHTAGVVPGERQRTDVKNTRRLLAGRLIYNKDQSNVSVETLFTVTVSTGFTGDYIFTNSIHFIDARLGDI